MGAFLVKGDALSPADVARVFAHSSLDDVNCVVSTIGGTPADPRADSEGNIALIDAAAAKGVAKFVLVTSVGCGSSASGAGVNRAEQSVWVPNVACSRRRFLTAQRRRRPCTRCSSPCCCRRRRRRST